MKIVKPKVLKKRAVSHGEVDKTFTNVSRNFSFGVHFLYHTEVDKSGHFHTVPSTSFQNSNLISVCVLVFKTKTLILEFIIYAVAGTKILKMEEMSEVNHALDQLLVESEYDAIPKAFLLMIQ